MSESTKDVTPRKIVELKQPVQFGSETIKQLELRPATAKDMYSLPLEPVMGDFAKVLGKLSGQPDYVIENLHPEDLFSAIGMLTDFLQLGPRTGEKPSG